MNKALEKMVHKVFYSCEMATFLIEKKASDQTISFLENLRLKGHLAMCKFCRAYNDKVSIMDKVLIKISNKSSEQINEAEVNEFINYLKDKNLN